MASTVQTSFQEQIESEESRGPRGEAVVLINGLLTNYLSNNYVYIIDWRCSQLEPEKLPSAVGNT